MKVKVIKEFVDIHTGELHEKGSSFVCDKDRFEEIKEKGAFVEEVPDVKKEKKEV